jgi:predicted nucleic acid-binding protein
MVLSGAENSGESQMRLRDMQKRTLKRPEFVESAPKYRQRTEITVFMRSLVYQGFQDFSAPLRMEWLKSLTNKIVGLDTAPLIYFVEENPIYTPLVDPFFTALDSADFQVVTSTVTLLEVLVQPFRVGDYQLASQYRDILLSQNSLAVAGMSPKIAEQAARLRASYNLRTPDAIQLATAIEAGASTFLTNDQRLTTITEIQILVLDSLL